MAMKVFLAGGTGVIGRRLVPSLVQGGHDVTATSRTLQGLEQIEAMGARGLELDALDRDAVTSTVVGAGPDVVVHQLTAIDTVDPKRFDASMAATNMLRTTALDHLMDAALATQATRFVAQSFTGWTNPIGGRLDYTEADPLDPDPHAATVHSLEAIAHLERVVTGAQRLTGVVTRFGHLYGPGTSYGEAGSTFQAVRDGKFPIVGGGSGVWSFVHIDDAVAATALAITTGATGAYNIVDDEPARVSEWLPAYAAAIGAPAPKKAPALLARLAIGGNGVRMMTSISGSSNSLARRELGWTPTHNSWRTGFSS